VKLSREFIRPLCERVFFIISESVSLLLRLPGAFCRSHSHPRDLLPSPRTLFAQLARALAFSVLLSRAGKGGNKNEDPLCLVWYGDFPIGFGSSSNDSNDTSRYKAATFQLSDRES